MTNNENASKSLTGHQGVLVVEQPQNTFFSKIMETGKDHIAISIRELKKNNLSLGRAKNEYVCLMNLDIRAGRTEKQKIKLIKTLISVV